MEKVADVRVAVPVPSIRSTIATPVRLLTGAPNETLAESEPAPFVCTHPGSKKLPLFWRQAVTSVKLVVLKRTPEPEVREFIASTCVPKPGASPDTVPETPTFRPEIVALPFVVLTLYARFRVASALLFKGSVMDVPGAAEMVNEGLRGLLASGVITKSEAGRLPRGRPFRAMKEAVNAKVLSPIVQVVVGTKLPRLMATQAESALARDGTSSAQQTGAIANKSLSFLIAPPKYSDCRAGMPTLRTRPDAQSFETPSLWFMIGARCVPEVRTYRPLPFLSVTKERRKRSVQCVTFPSKNAQKVTHWR